MGKTLLKAVLGAVAVLLVVAAPGRCDTIPTVTVGLISTGSGFYAYGITITGATGSYFNFFQGDTITLSGMAGVTGDAVGGDLSGFGFGPNGVPTSTTASMKLLPNVLQISLTTGTTNLGSFIVDSLATPGTIYWTISGPSNFPGQIPSTYDIEGTATGPVTTPEPSSLVLMLSGLAGLALMAGLARREEALGQTT